MISEESKKTGILRSTEDYEYDYVYYNKGVKYPYTYPSTGTFEELRDIEGKVRVNSTEKREDNTEYGILLPEVNGLETEVKIIPDLAVQSEFTGTNCSVTRFTTVTTYTEVNYYKKSATLEYISTIGNKGRSCCKSSATTGTRTVAVAEKIINYVRYIATGEKIVGATGTSTTNKLYYTTKPRNQYTKAVTTYIGNTLDTLVVNRSVAVPSTEKFIFPSTVVKYRNSPYSYFISTLQYCIDTCSLSKLRYWVAGLYLNSTYRKWLYYLNKYPRARFIDPPTKGLQELVKALNTVFIFGYPLVIVKRNPRGTWHPSFTNSTINQIVGDYFNFPYFKATTTELEQQYIEDLKAKEFKSLPFNTSIAQKQVDSYGYIHIRYAGKIIASRAKRSLVNTTITTSPKKKQRTEKFEESAYV